MSRLLIFVLISATCVLCNELNDKESAREEKLRSALIDAFQNIKKASAKGGVDDESLDLIGSINSNTSNHKSTTEDSFDLFADEDGLSFGEKFSKNDTEKLTPGTEKSHNVQHLIKTTKTIEFTTNKPNRDVFRKLNDSIRNTVNETRMQMRNTFNDTNLLSLESMLRVFDAEILLQQWDELKSTVSGMCKEDMQEYIEGLRERALWALKMEDASGRYTSMFYWGNNYWTGSVELCQILNQHHAPYKHNNRSAGSQIFNEWRQDVSMTGLGPPFDTAFYNVKMSVTTDLHEIIRTRRTVHLGVCLPRSCGRRQVGGLVAAARAPLLRHQVLAVRSPEHGNYSYILDPTFQILLGVCCVVATLLITATVYDMQIAKEVRARRRRVNNMAAAESGAGLDAITVSKGKSLYSVNNNIAINSNNSEESLTAETSSTDEEIKLSVWSELLLSFSMKANILQILDQSVGADTVPVVHGLRTLSMVWVIFGHTCIVVFKYADNTALRAILEKSFWFQLIISAVYSVDTFFCLGGMLVTFLYFRTNAKGKLDRLTKGRRKVTAGLLQFLGLIGYRFARLTTPYLFMLGVVEVTMKWFAHNSIFEPPAMDHETCPKYWWRNLLYINTLFPVDQMCMLWSWYLSDDTQFYAVSAILLILATSHFKLSVILTGVFFVSSLFTTGYVSWSSEHIPNSEDPFTQFDKIYDKPWTRLGPYLVGMVTGWILFKTNLKIRMNRVWTCVGWICCTGMLLFLIFGLYRSELSVASAAVYSAVSHSLWAAAIGWIIIACSTGHGGWLHALLSAPVLYPFSRVTYCAYLVHPVVLRVVAMHLTHPIHLGEMLVFVLFLGLTVISYFLAFLISVAFEAPIVTMLKIVSPQKKPHRV
ncbi:nose resistant to fluoxetine protein 6-like isoform X2 [Leptidea sinapis]|uniref:nose resistant to fluoxetine protein 6-like isoform X2 n=1 Tax=Leptidea sinapis TaxID=189913 RepID=UPI0021C26B47|nr:nose resistant to fluoxetine protein 6-like isoform X2 [Leptidea sinapis]